MKLYWNANVSGWRMTGIVGRNGAWFLGFSRLPPESADERWEAHIRMERLIYGHRAAQASPDER